PVTNMDLFPTLLELAGVPVPTVSTAKSLLRPESGRVRVGTYATPTVAILEQARTRNPALDLKPFERGLQAFYRGPWKLIVASDGSRWLYDLQHDPREQSDLAPLRGEIADSLAGDLAHLLAAARKPAPSPDRIETDAETRARLEALGYGDE